ncbi:PIN domain-containing protein [Cellulosimicrobium protaetiae]|uniref:PIN domain-containing protein n=1 Tax=Cellulosimicrobium protaetiae TaxID=2587808 RepID=UPI0020A43C8E|nr:PIN domain-containing protein [Cellulosimicrobium protaetiae]
MIVLLDTNVLVDLARHDLDPQASYGASIFSRAELELGIRAARSSVQAAERRRHLNDLDDRFDWIDFDLDCTRSYGLLAAHAKGRVTGARVRGKDALIAAQAHRHGAAVMTANRDDFRPFEELVQVLSPRRAEA